MSVDSEAVQAERIKQQAPPGGRRPIGWPALLSRDLVMDTSNGILQHSLPLDIAGTHLTMTAQYARPGAFTVFQITTKLRTKALIFLLP